jgi:hypothetical protein
LVLPPCQKNMRLCFSEIFSFEKYTEKILPLPKKTIQDLAICSYRWINWIAWVEKVICSHFHPQSLTHKTADNYYTRNLEFVAMNNTILICLHISVRLGVACNGNRSSKSYKYEVLVSRLLLEVRINEILKHTDHFSQKRKIKPF